MWDVGEEDFSIFIREKSDGGSVFGGSEIVCEYLWWVGLAVRIEIGENDDSFAFFGEVIGVAKFFVGELVVVGDALLIGVGGEVVHDPVSVIAVVLDALAPAEGFGDVEVAFVIEADGGGVLNFV